MITEHRPNTFPTNYRHAIDDGRDQLDIEVTDAQVADFVAFLRTRK